MKKPIVVLFILFCVAQISMLSAQTVPEPSGRRLRDIVDDKYSDNSILIGATTGAWKFDTNTSEIMDREFNYVTPENDFKQWNIHPDPDTWNWTQPDDWIEHIEDYDQVLRMHCPIGPQCSNWTQTDTRTAEELEPVMRDFMQAVCERYNDEERVISMDVVNETVENGHWKKNEEGTGGWEMPWYIIGPDTDANATPLFIRYAFEIANEYAPDLKLIYNHHEDPNSTTSWNLIKETIGYLRDLGLRVDGIGWQAHVNNGWGSAASLNRLRELIDWAHENDLEFHVTEASVWINGEHTEAAYETQATTYTKILEVLLEKRLNGVVGWNIWHIDDGAGWNVDLVPSLFNANYEAKPAYYAIQQLLENPPSGIVESPTQVVSSFQLQDNYPNPFNSTTIINYNVPANSHVSLSIYNLSGQKIKTLINNTQTSGYQSVTWNGEDNWGNEVSSGTYIYRLQTDNSVQMKKMLYLK